MIKSIILEKGFGLKATAHLSLSLSPTRRWKQKTHKAQGCEKIMSDEKKDDEVKLTDTGEIELPQLDLTPYIGKKAKIEAVTEHKGDYGYYIKIQTDVIDKLTEKRKEPLELRASRIFSLQEDEEGKIGWGKETNLGIFLKKKGVKHYNDLIGTEVIVQTITNKKQQRDFLSFN